MPKSRVKTNKRFVAGSQPAGRPEPLCTPWTAWARSLIDRYEQVKQPHNSLDMALVHPFTTIRLIRERWLVATRELRPQINLFLNPKLGVRRRHPSHVVNRFAYVGNESYVRATSLTLVGASSHASDLPVDQDSYAGEPDLTTRFSPSIAQHLSAARLERDVRELVTTRRRAIDETSRIRTSELILGNANALAQRLLTHTRRVEERIGGLAELTLRRISATVERQTASDNSAADESAAQARLAAYQGATSMQAAFDGRAIDFDQLTERVIRELDRRVVAVRERMGRR